MPKTFATPGPRSIYPEMCDSRSLSRCGLLANALWPRLIVQADDQGRLHGDAADIRGLCFPKMPRVTARAVGDALAELADVGSIARYDVDDEPYLQIRDWWQYQAYQRRAFPSRFPAPEGWKDVIYGLAGFPETYEQATKPPRRAAAPRRVPPLRAQAPTQPAALGAHAAGVPSRPTRSKPVQSTARGKNGSMTEETTTPFGEAMTANGVSPLVSGKPA
jgi:hypothetical protein